MSRALDDGDILSGESDCILSEYDERAPPDAGGVPSTNTLHRRRGAAGAREYSDRKLFVGMLPKAASAQEVEQLFSPYGRLVL